ncbi:hypothetical protein ACFY2N_31905 [Streptomyces rubiginosohelvolus]
MPKETTGLDANNKAPDKRRRLAVDALGLITGAATPAASAQL